jgi:hypothetical protein
MFVIMKWRPSRSEEHLYISNYFLEYYDGILPTAKASVNAWAGVLFYILIYFRLIFSHYFEKQ